MFTLMIADTVFTMTRFNVSFIPFERCVCVCVLSSVVLSLQMIRFDVFIMARGQCCIAFTLIKRTIHNCIQRKSLG